MYTTSSTILRHLKSGILLLFLVMISPSAFTLHSPVSPAENDIKINPECKIKRLSNGSVIVLAKNLDGVEVKHEFTDLYADLLMAYYRKQRSDYIMDSISKKYYLSEDECRREIKHALNVLAEWNIILRSDKMASR